MERLIGDDGVTLASRLVLESKEAYMDLANDPSRIAGGGPKLFPFWMAGVRSID